MPEQIRVLIVDDHPVVRSGLRMMLEMDEHISTVGEAANGKIAVRMAAELHPDVILMDLRMPEMDGLTAIQEIRRNQPEIALIILTTYDEDDLMMQGLQAGVRGYLLKDSGLESVLQAIHAAARGEMLLQPELMERVLSYRQPFPPPTEPKSDIVLTEREKEVLSGVARGERNKEIAVHMGITRRTVESYLTTIYTKFGVDSRAGAVAFALEKGILPRGILDMKNP